MNKAASAADKAKSESNKVRCENHDPASLPAGFILFYRKNCGLPKGEKLKAETLKTEIGGLRPAETEES